MAANVTIAMLKDVPVKWDIARNWAVFEQQVGRLEPGDADVLITPECYLDGYAVTEKDWTVERFREMAQCLEESAYIARVREMAREKRVAIVFGCTELRQGHFYNAGVVIDREGELLGVYHKTHLQTHDVRFARGEDLPVFDLHFGRVGLVICADRRWPESIRTLRLKGAKICLMPTYGMWHDRNEMWMRTRSYENQMFVCFTHPSVALITDPRGDVAAKLQSNVADVLRHTVDLDEARDDNHLVDRRPDLYGVLADVDHPSMQKPFEPPRA